MHDEGSISGMIKILAGLVITLLLVAAVFGIWNLAKGGIDNASDKLNNLNAKLAKEDYENMNGRTDINGADISEFISTHYKDAVEISVSINGSKTNYNVDDSAYGNDYSKWAAAFAKTKNKKEKTLYINPSAKYSCEVTYNADETIKSIEFTNPPKTTP